jgi:hypothetical protein
MRRIIIPTSLLLLASSLSLWAQATNWVAFNDYRPTVGVTAPNVTGYDLRLTGEGGVLTDFFSGAELPASVVVESLGAPDDFGANMYPNPGTPSYELFNGIIDLGNLGLPGLRAAGAATVTLVFTNLDPSQRYVFRGTVSRGNNYVNRWSVFTIRADAFTDAHVDGSANTNIFTVDTFPSAGASLVQGQVALNTGENRDGSLIGWDDIAPDANGTFAISGERYLGPTPYGDAADPGTAYAYGINALMLAEISSGPPAPPAIVSQPVDTAVGERETALLRVSATGTGPLRYQWYKGTPPNGTLVPAATRSTFRVVDTTGSGVNWSIPDDSGQYYVVVTGGIAPPVTSRVATVSVSPDTTPPAMVQAVCGATDTEIIVTLSEPAADDGAFDREVSDFLNWDIRGVDGSADIGTISVTYTKGDTNVYLNTTPRTPGAAYRVVRSVDLHDTAVAHNVLPAGSGVGVFCFDTELLALNASWRYNDSDIDPGANWFQEGYDDSAAPWRAGPGPFDAKRRAVETDPDCRLTALHNLGDVGTCINLTSPVTLTNLITAYFRTRFTFTGDPTKSILRLNGKLDDGGVIYLNGTELTRIGMAPPPAVIDHVTLATRTVNDTDAQDVLAFYFPASLRRGDNLLAVSLHQSTLASSDFTMGLRVAVSTQTPVPFAPALQLTRSGQDIVIRWAPATGVLQSANTLGAAWQDVTPQPPVGGPLTTTATGPSKFYRVRP